MSDDKNNERALYLLYLRGYIAARLGDTESAALTDIVDSMDEDDPEEKNIEQVRAIAIGVADGKEPGYAMHPRPIQAVLDHVRAC